jgi:hypothetical protein
MRERGHGRRELIRRRGAEHGALGPRGAVRGVPRFLNFARHVQLLHTLYCTEPVASTPWR